ncbi:PilZ domain-containing protein [Stutzerimonas sp. NM35]
MAEKTTLTRTELAYINRLISNSRAESEDTQSGFRIDGGEHANGLLLQLAAKASLTLEAELDEYSMTFPLRLDEDELHGIQLQLAPPTIYERGPVLRAWRLQLEEPLALLSDDGNETALSVHELSPHGLLVDTGSQKKAPKHLHLHLALPGEDPLKIDAHQVRNAADGMTVYEVEYENKDAERIRSYLYEQHQRLHPELQQELPVESSD